MSSGDFCPLLKKDCVQMKCNWFIQVRGTDPNTGSEVDEWGCSIAWLPTMLIENAGQARQTGAAVKSFHEEMVKANNETMQVMLAVAESRNDEPVRISYASDDRKAG